MISKKNVVGGNVYSSIYIQLMKRTNFLAGFRVCCKEVVQASVDLCFRFSHKQLWQQDNDATWADSSKNTWESSEAAIMYHLTRRRYTTIPDVRKLSRLCLSFSVLQASAEGASSKVLLTRRRIHLVHTTCTEMK